MAQKYKNCGSWAGLSLADRIFRLNTVLGGKLFPDYKKQREFKSVSVASSAKALPLSGQALTKKNVHRPYVIF